MSHPVVDLILDSGAYSAWKRQESLTLKGLLTFIDRHEGCFSSVVNLDKIPGQWGRIPSSEEVEHSAEVSWAHATKMRKHGVADVMPVYHMGERRYWLEKMMGEGFKYVGISPANDKTTKQKRAWLDEVFGFLCGTKGFPAIKTHAFGVSALPLLFRYPWYSVDAITWYLVAGMGCIFVPHRDEHDAWDFTRSPMILNVCDSKAEKSRNGPTKHARHIRNVGEKTRDYVKTYLHEQGYSIRDVRGTYLTRVMANGRFWALVNERSSVREFVNRDRGLFYSASSHGQETPIEERTRIIFTLNMTWQVSHAAQINGMRNRMLSYYFFKDKDPFNIRKYVACGEIPRSKKAKKVTV